MLVRRKPSLDSFRDEIEKNKRIELIRLWFFRIRELLILLWVIE